jgi:hypothetical protein
MIRIFFINVKEIFFKKTKVLRGNLTRDWRLFSYIDYWFPARIQNIVNASGDLYCYFANDSYLKYSGIFYEEYYKKHRTPIYYWKRSVIRTWKRIWVPNKIIDDFWTAVLLDYKEHYRNFKFKIFGWLTKFTFRFGILAFYLGDYLNWWHMRNLDPLYMFGYFRVYGHMGLTCIYDFVAFFQYYGCLVPVVEIFGRFVMFMDEFPEYSRFYPQILPPRIIQSVLIIALVIFVVRRLLDYPWEYYLVQGEHMFDFIYEAESVPPFLWLWSHGRRRALLRLENVYINFDEEELAEMEAMEIKELEMQAWAIFKEIWRWAFLPFFLTTQFFYWYVIRFAFFPLWVLLFFVFFVKECFFREKSWLDWLSPVITFLSPYWLSFLLPIFRFTITNYYFRIVVHRLVGMVIYQYEQYWYWRYVTLAERWKFKMEVLRQEMRDEDIKEEMWLRRDAEIDAYYYEVVIPNLFRDVYLKWYGFRKWWLRMALSQGFYHLRFFFRTVVVPRWYWRVVNRIFRPIYRFSMWFFEKSFGGVENVPLRAFNFSKAEITNPNYKVLYVFGKERSPGYPIYQIRYGGREFPLWVYFPVDYFFLKYILYYVGPPLYKFVIYRMYKIFRVWYFFSEFFSYFKKYFKAYFRVIYVFYLNEFWYPMSALLKMLIRLNIPYPATWSMVGGHHYDRAVGYVKIFFFPLGLLLFFSVVLSDFINFLQLNDLYRPLLWMILLMGWLYLWSERVRKWLRWEMNDLEVFFSMCALIFIINYTVCHVVYKKYWKWNYINTFKRRSNKQYTWRKKPWDVFFLINFPVQLSSFIYYFIYDVFGSVWGWFVFYGYCLIQPFFYCYVDNFFILVYYFFYLKFWFFWKVMWFFVVLPVCYVFSWLSIASDFFFWDVEVPVCLVLFTFLYSKVDRIERFFTWHLYHVMGIRHYLWHRYRHIRLYKLDRTKFRDRIRPPIKKKRFRQLTRYMIRWLWKEGVRPSRRGVKRHGSIRDTRSRSRYTHSERFAWVKGDNPKRTWKWKPRTWRIWRMKKTYGRFNIVHLHHFVKRHPKYFTRSVNVMMFKWWLFVMIPTMKLWLLPGMMGTLDGLYYFLIS